MTPVIAPSDPLRYASSMPITIGRRPAPPGPKNPADMLTECHDRIRQAMRGARGLTKVAADDPAVAPTAAAVHRYFAIALPLHSQDEDLSLAPRLFAAGMPEELADAVRAMTAQHAAIDALLERLLPIWDRLQHAPADLDAVRDALAADTAQLDAVWDVHLTMEEAFIFPRASAALDATAQAEIAEEMRGRRQPKSETPSTRRP